MIKSYIFIARPDHWFKNVFMLPGTLVAAALTHAPINTIANTLCIGMISACLIASANYVINEWLDAEFDRFHPIKKKRPSVTGKVKSPFVYLEYAVLAAGGLALAALISDRFLLTSFLFLIMGFIYNVKPFRTKDRIFLDVLSESVNNPIRLMLGWFIVTDLLLPPSSLILGYWMGGAFLMGVKRYAEYRFIADPELAGRYRRSFKKYTEETLIIASFFYGMCSLFFVGIFLIKYRIELLLGIPLIALLFAWYLHVGMKPNSLAQHPEQLYKEKTFMLYVALTAVSLAVLMFVDLPVLYVFLNGFLETGTAP